MSNGVLVKHANFDALLKSNPVWSDKACMVIAALFGFEGIGEDLQRVIVQEIGEPSHPNVWGATINQAIKRGFLEATGEYRAMRLDTSHGRESRVYRSTKR